MICRKRISVTFGGPLSVALLGLSDGAFVWEEGADLNEATQKAIIHWANGTETMVLQVRFRVDDERGPMTPEWVYDALGTCGTWEAVEVLKQAAPAEKHQEWIARAVYGLTPASDQGQAATRYSRRIDRKTLIGSQESHVGSKKGSSNDL